MRVAWTSLLLVLPVEAFADEPAAGFHVAPVVASVETPTERLLGVRCTFLDGCDSQERHERELSGKNRIERFDVPFSKLPIAAVTVVSDGRAFALRRLGASAPSELDPIHRGEAPAVVWQALHAGVENPIGGGDRFTVDPAIGMPDAKWAAPFLFEAEGRKLPDGRFPFDFIEGTGDQQHPLRVTTWGHADAVEVMPGLVALIRTTPVRTVMLSGLVEAALPVDDGAANVDRAPRDGLDGTERVGQLASLGAASSSSILIDAHGFDGEADPTLRIRVRR
jgi:hypothetical protein